jgi:predicted thioesterase
MTGMTKRRFIYDTKIAYFVDMINPFNIGDVKTYTHVVVDTDAARFESGEVHNVYSTFALARDAEWAGRLFVLEMKETGEEGIGTGITVTHHAPALVGQEVIFTATLTEVNKNEVVVDYTAKVGNRLIGTGKTWQKIIKKEKLNHLFESLK